MHIPGRPRQVRKMRIFKKEPITWQELQERVRLILQDAGYDAECDKSIKTVRGQRNVDVYAVYNNAKYAPTIKVICECKHWNAKIPRQIVDGFQTILTGAGANIGYIISKRGFQSGAFEAATHTSIKLMTYRQFEEEIFLQWHRHVKKDLSKFVKIAWDWMDKTNPEKFGKGSKHPLVIKRKKLWRRSQILRDAGWVTNGEPIYTRFLGPKSGNYNGPDKQINITDLEEYIKEIKKTCLWICKEVKNLSSK